MSPSVGSGAGRTRRKGPPRRLEPEEANRRIVEVCAFYCGGPGREAGRRITWECPYCAKPKLEVLPEGPVGGCWNASCPVPTSADAISLAAFFEDLDRRGDFPRLMARLGEILDGPGASPGNTGRRDRAAVREAPASPLAEPAETADPEVAGEAYRIVLSSCPATPASLAYWAGRGLEEATARRAGLAYATPKRVFAAIAAAERRLGGRLLSVPGFFRRGERPGERPGGEARVRFTLTGEYHLIPYHDREGRIRTIEGRATEAQRRRLREAGIKAKYVSLRGSGNHLYLFPSLPLDGIEAFTEGTAGAIVAAQEGVPVGAIKGIRCYTSPDGSPLPELAGASFGGRTVPYVPDADWPPKADVVREAPKAAASLSVPHGGVPALAYLPRGLDLDEWLISLPKNARRAALRDLLARASPLPVAGHA